MPTYSVFVMDYLVLDAEDEDDARQQAKAWFREMLENDEVTWDIEEGDASGGEEDDVTGGIE
ncbi:MAG: hypothetical protein M0R74_13300 [Dehalococcoidia bacterium]|nr:hypothetical protein [Dehalococcoidia bacterium]